MILDFQLLKQFPPLSSNGCMHFPTPYEYENVLTGNQQRCLITVEITDYCESLNSFWLIFSFNVQEQAKCYEDKTRRRNKVKW